MNRDITKRSKVGSMEKETFNNLVEWVRQRFEQAEITNTRQDVIDIMFSIPEQLAKSVQDVIDEVNDVTTPLN